MVTRILVEKRNGFNVEAEALRDELVRSLHLENLESLRIVNCYDFDAVDPSNLERIKSSILSEPNVDIVSEETFEMAPAEIAFRIALLPGQYDQRADSAAQCIEIITLEKRPEIVASKIIVLLGSLKPAEIEAIKHFMINPVEAHEVAIGKPETLKLQTQAPSRVDTVEGFIDLGDSERDAFQTAMGFAMTKADLKAVQHYFKTEEKRNPTVTELKVIDTYWSDHCRHTTFMTELKSVEIEEGLFTQPIKRAYDTYKEMRQAVYPNGNRPLSLMDLATINMKTLRLEGGLEDLDVSDEINACSIKVDIDVDGTLAPWLLMFKNETHNHPTEIEPYGGAATCLGGAIRDPLSGRSYVYQSMRVTGAGNPLARIEDTLDGKLPQKIITQKAAAGFSGYGNQIGLATGLVSEVYDDGFIAKRMEVGAVIGATPQANVIRMKPVAGDLILLIGGRTGRDGVGGATGSSKAHDADSLLECGAEVQKGNPPEERKIQRLFRNPELSKKIKKCNDFGAGGISVAIGELADSLEIDLDKVPKKYDGLDGTELAISESQERMAVVIAPNDLEAVMGFCAVENLEATVVAVVHDHGRLVMTWKGQSVLDISREFLETNGVKAEANVRVTAPKSESFFAKTAQKTSGADALETKWLSMLSDLNVCSQKGLVERFDNTIGAGTVLMPYGGIHYSTPIQTMVAKFPVMGAQTQSVSMMSYGYNPNIGKWSPFHGGLYAVVESVAKIVATGGDHLKIRLSLQEYFEKLGDKADKWGKPMAALLGASMAQKAFGTAAIGGKDSMSGSFNDLDVPPTLIAFAVSHGRAEQIISPEFKKSDSALYYFYAARDAEEMVDFYKLNKAYTTIHRGILSGQITSAYAIGQGGLAGALSKMSFGNGIGFRLTENNRVNVFEEAYGSIVIEAHSDFIASLNGDAGLFIRIGETLSENLFEMGTLGIDGNKALSVWEAPLESVFPTQHHDHGKATTFSYNERTTIKPAIRIAKPKVFIPVFPGTNCEYDTQRAFEKAGAHAETIVFRNLTANDVKASIEAFVKMIESSQMIVLPGGFSAGDEPEGSGKFIASVFRNPQIAEAVMKLLTQRDGLMLGICNGFQALVKLGLLPYGEIRDLDPLAPTLTFNKIGRHVARMADVRVSSVHSPWLSDVSVGDVFKTAFSHGEGRFYASDASIETMAKNGQIATQYVGADGHATLDGKWNINGSVHAIEGVLSPDGRIFGKMGHVERVGKNLYKNIYGENDFDIFKSGVSYFK